MSIVGKKRSIATIMENGAIKHPLLVEAMEIVEKVTYIIYWHFLPSFVTYVVDFKIMIFSALASVLGGF